MKVILDFINVDTKAKLFYLFNDNFNFNEDCNNLDALYDCLSEDPNYEFEIKDSTKYEIYQIQLINTVVDAGCQVTYLTKESPL